MIEPDVIVVGAGCAGLSCAARLARHGRRVLVLEARARLGGRATAFPDRETGELVDNGQHVLLGCYTETLAFLRDIGAAEHVRLQPQLDIPVVDAGGRRSRLRCADLPAPFHLLAGIFDWEALTWTDRLAALKMARPLRLARRAMQPGSRTLAASPGETVENWLIRNGQTPRLRELLWGPLALAALNQPAAEAAAPIFARVLAEAFGSDARAAAIATPTVPLHQMFAEPARRFIEARGGQVVTGAAAKLRIDAGRISAASPHQEWSAPAAVSAVPWFSLPDLFDTPPAAMTDTFARARATAATPIVTVNLWFDRPVMDEPFLGLPGRVIQWVFDKRALWGGRHDDAASHLSLVSSGAAAIVHLENAELIRRAHDELIAALPAARQANLTRASVIREPHAGFSVAPGQPARPSTRTGVPGFFLAGDWIDTGLPATIESAVRSGHWAAEAILQYPAA
jgi:hydroxysqualene dehydroxylase